MTKDVIGEFTTPTVGLRMTDGTICAGISPGTGKLMYTTPEDAPRQYTFADAPKYAQRLNRERAFGYSDWRVPSEDELDVLFKNRDAIGGFDQTGVRPQGWYWSSSQKKPGNHARGQRFSDGHRSSTNARAGASLRCVRG